MVYLPMKLLWFVNLQGQMVIPTKNMISSVLKEIGGCQFLIIDHDIACVEGIQDIEIDDATNIFVDTKMDDLQPNGRIVVCRSQKMLRRAVRNDSVVVNIIADRMTMESQSASDKADGIYVVCDSDKRTSILFEERGRILFERNQAKLPNSFNVYTFSNNQLKQVSI